MTEVSKLVPLEEYVTLAIARWKFILSACLSVGILMGIRTARMPDIYEVKVKLLKIETEALLPVKGGGA